MITDEQGNRYYHTEEAWRALKISRSTFLKRAGKANLEKFHMEDDKRMYYRVEDVEALKNRPVKMIPIEKEKKAGKRAALAPAC